MKKKFERVFTLLLAALLVVSMAGCGGTLTGSKTYERRSRRPERISKTHCSVLRVQTRTPRTEREELESL